MFVFQLWPCPFGSSLTSHLHDNICQHLCSCATKLELIWMRSTKTFSTSADHLALLILNRVSIKCPFLSFRNKMKKKVIRKKTVAWKGSPGGNWSPTGTVIRNQRSRKWMMTCPLGEAPTTTFCWSQQVSSDHQKLVFFVTSFWRLCLQKYGSFCYQR